MKKTIILHDNHIEEVIAFDSEFLYIRDKGRKLRYLQVSDVKNPPKSMQTILKSKGWFGSDFFGEILFLIDDNHLVTNEL